MSVLIPVPTPDRDMTEPEMWLYIQHALQMKLQAEHAAAVHAAKSFDQRGRMEDTVLKRGDQVRAYLRKKIHGDEPDVVI